MRRAIIRNVGRLSILIVLALAGCTGPSTEGTGDIPPCDQKCQDESASRALRETMKLAFNLTLQGKPVGTHDVSTPCPQGGTGRIQGTAFSNPQQGATEVDLVYTFDKCSYLLKDDTPISNYRMTLSGKITQKGIIAVEPSATTGLVIGSDNVTFDGTVYEPPIPFKVENCVIAFGQNGNRLSGTLCGREVAVSL